MVSEKIGKDIFKAVDATRNNKVLHEESPITTKRDIRTMQEGPWVLNPKSTEKWETEGKFTWFLMPKCIGTAQSRAYFQSVTRQKEDETILGHKLIKSELN